MGSSSAIGRLGAFTASFGGRAGLLTAALAATVMVVAGSMVMNLRAQDEADAATQRLLSVMRVANELSATLTNEYNMMMMSTARPDLASPENLDSIGARADALMAEMAQLSVTAPERALAREAAEARRPYRDAQRRLIEILREGDQTAARAYMESPQFYVMSLAANPSVRAWVRQMPEEARDAQARSDAAERTALTLAGIGVVVIAALWGFILADWMRQTMAAKRAQAKLANVNADLERRVAERTQELAGALDRAESANRAKSEFLAAMSHELRTPLNGVLGMTSVLSRSEMNESQQGMLKVIEDSGRSLLTLLNDVLDYARLEAGKLELRNEPFDLGEVLDRLVAKHRSDAEAKGLSLTTDMDPGARGVFIGDETRVGQAIGNLLSNGVKFTEAGSVTVTASETGSGAVRIAVRDTGCGISPEMQAAIFERFSQGDYSSRRRHGGTGLGLALAQELISVMGGEIGVESAEGEGSEFWVELPLERWNASGGSARVEAA